MDTLSIDILKIIKDKDLPVILCLGSDRVLGDCVGPMVGEMLQRKYKVPTFVYGTLSNNITSINIDRTIQFIKENHKGKKLLVIDCGIGGLNMVGSIKVCEGSVLPVCYKERIGDMQIIAYTSFLGATNKLFLRTTRIQTVTSMATRIARCISEAINIVQFAYNV